MCIKTQFKTKPKKAKTATIIMNRDREKSNKEKLKKPHSIRVHAQATLNSDYMQREKKKKLNSTFRNYLNMFLIL